MKNTKEIHVVFMEGSMAKFMNMKPDAVSFHI